MDPVNPQYIYKSSLLHKGISEETIYFIAQESTAISG